MFARLKWYLALSRLTQHNHHTTGHQRFRTSDPLNFTALPNVTPLSKLGRTTIWATLKLQTTSHSDQTVGLQRPVIRRPLYMRTSLGRTHNGVQCVSRGHDGHARCNYEDIRLTCCRASNTRFIAISLPPRITAHSIGKPETINGRASYYTAHQRQLAINGLTVT